MNKRFNNNLSSDYVEFEKNHLNFYDFEENIFSILRKYIDKAFSKEFNNKINILEIWCGTWTTTEIILNSDSRIKRTTVDNEFLMIEQMNKKLFSNIFCWKIDVFYDDALSFLKKQKSNSFDGFVSAFTLHNFDKFYRKNVLIEIFRILKKWSIFINADKYAIDDDFLHKKSLNVQILELKKINNEALKNKWISHYLDDNKNDFIMKEKESLKIMENIWFKDLDFLHREWMKNILIAKK